MEQKINTYKINGTLDESAKYIFNQDGYIPILRSIDILLNSNNTSNLNNFLKGVNMYNIYKSYISYIGNKINQDLDYIPSLKIIKNFLINNNITVG